MYYIVVNNYFILSIFIYPGSAIQRGTKDRKLPYRKNNKSGLGGDPGKYFFSPMFGWCCYHGQYLEILNPNIFLNIRNKANLFPTTFPLQLLQSYKCVYQTSTHRITHIAL